MPRSRYAFSEKPRGRKFNKSSPSQFHPESCGVSKPCLLRDASRPSSANSDKLLLTRRAGQTLATPLYLDRVEPLERRENTKESTQNARRAATRRDETRGRTVSRRRSLDAERNRIMSSVDLATSGSQLRQRDDRKNAVILKEPPLLHPRWPLDARQ